jgi:beta-N-acetylhexosaminidase
MKYQDESCNGVRIVVTNRRKFDPVLMGVHLLNMINELYPEELVVQEESLNRLFGTDELSMLIQGEIEIKEILDIMAEDMSIFLELRKPYLLYP